MQSFVVIIELSRRLGVRTTVIERGGLPNSLYYADEVVYGDHDYHNIDNILSTYIPKHWLSLKLDK